MKKNDKIELDIVDMTKDGLGLAKVDGQVFFVKDGLIGDKVEAVITKVDKNIIYSKVLNIVEKSNYRVKSSCNVSNACGGCQLLNLDYKKQIELKKNYVLSCLKKIGKFNNIIIVSSKDNNVDLNISESAIDENDTGENIDAKYSDSVLYSGIIETDNIYNFRNKMQVPFAERNEEIIYGFYAGRTHIIVECDKCIVGFKDSEKILHSIKQALIEFGLSIYDEKTHEGIFREVMLRKGNVSNEVSITYIVNDKNYKNNIDLYQKFDSCVMKKYNDIDISSQLVLSTSTLNINTSNNNVIFGNNNVVLRGSGYIIDSIGNVKYHISPESFYQVNIDMTKKLYDTVLEFADFKGDERVLDLYCGIGTISLYIAKYVKNVCGIEIVEKAVENAKENAKINNIKNSKFICENIANCGINKGIFDEKGHNNTISYEDNIKIVFKNGSYDTIIIDPPRKGLDIETIEFIKHTNPKKIIYVSCDPATLSRDLNILCHESNGLYKLVEVKNVDMFPHTMHIETVCLIKHL